MEIRKLITITLYARQQKRHRCIEQSFGLCGRGRGWDDLGECHWNVYYHIRNGSPVQVLCRIQDARGWCTGMTQRDGTERVVGGRFRMGNTCTPVPHPESPSHLPLHSISLSHPSAPAPSILYPASKLDWRFVSYMILYMFQCHCPKSSHPLPLLQSPKDCSIHLCLFCCLAYRVIFLNSIYMH